MFERPHHQRIEQALRAMDAKLLLKHGCLFGGGTAIALAYGEHRESVDMDFICASVEGYREIRGLVNGAGMGVAKALHAYGPSVLDDVKKARAQLLDRKGRLRDCMKNLGMSMPEAELRRRIQAIRPNAT